MKRIINMSGLSEIMKVTKSRVHQFVNDGRIKPDYQDNDGRYFFLKRKATMYAEMLQSQKSLPRKKRRSFEEL